jgi:hypothetical protein
MSYGANAAIYVVQHTCTLQCCTIEILAEPSVHGSLHVARTPWVKQHECEHRSRMQALTAVFMPSGMQSTALGQQQVQVNCGRCRHQERSCSV